MKNIYLFLGLTLSALFCSCGEGGDATVKLIPVQNGNDYGYIDWDGKIVINPQFAEAGLFVDGLALIRTSGAQPQYGYIDSKGAYVINPQFVQATDFSDGVALTVKANEAPKGINQKGEVLFEIKNAQSVTNYSEGLAGYSVENEEGLNWGFIDNKGTSVINPQFGRVGNFNEGKCAVMNKEGKWGYVDKTGKIIVNTQFSSAGIFKNGKAVVFDSSGKAGLIDDTGKYLINPQFQNMVPDGENFIVASGDRYGWADSEGKIIINTQFEGAYPFNGNGTAPVRQGNNWGYIDEKGTYVINPQFDFAYPFVGGKALVRSGKDIGIIDKKGSYVVNPQFSGIGNGYNFFALSEKNSQTIVSDYFDVESISNAVKKEITANSVNGFTFSTPLSEMMAKYPQHALNYYYGSNNSLYQNKEINKYADLSLMVEGTIFIQSGWSFVPNPNATVDAFTFIINAKGKALTKTEDILKSFEKGFNGYQKEANANGGRFQFSNGNMILTVGQIGGRVAIRVSKNNSAAETTTAENENTEEVTN
jgi:hypothetical protein